MKNKNRPNHKKRTLALVIILALLCIGGTELLFCRHFAPEEYNRIVAPVRRAAAAVGEACRSVAGMAAQSWADFTGQVSAYWAELTAPKPEPEPEPELESQLASEPTLATEAYLDPSLTELKVVDGQELLTGGNLNLVYFNQGDEAWATQPYGSDQIGGYGCGPAAMAMVVSSMTDTQIDPAAMAQWAVEHGYWARKSGSYLSIVEGTAQAFGLHAETFSERTPDALVDTLISGNILVALMGPGHFTQRGHFILLRGVTMGGEILVADPNSNQRSLVAWDAQLILDELSSSTHNGAPLWVISQEAISDLELLSEPDDGASADLAPR